MKRCLLAIVATLLGCAALGGCEGTYAIADSHPSTGGVGSSGTGASGTGSGSASTDPVIQPSDSGNSSGNATTGGTSNGSGSGAQTDSGGNPSGNNGGNNGGNTGGGGAQVNTNPGFVNLAPPMGAPLDPAGMTVTPPPPAGWVWYEIEGALCRDGSPTGFYVRYTSSKKLLFYLEGGGACTSPGFCNFNPASVGQVLLGDLETPIGSAFGAGSGRQQPGTAGIFDTANSANPVKDWNMIYVPYCTGDVHFGSKPNSSLPGVSQPQQFVGHLNMKKFVARIVPTFKDKVDLVLLSGSSAGGFGTVLNYSMVQDAFGAIPVKAVDDSGPAFADAYFPVCMQKRWRQLWGMDDSFPSDCAECRQADGGGLARWGDYMVRKHPNFSVGLLSSMRDEIIRLFYSAGNNSCAGFETSEMVGTFLGANGGMISADVYTQGLEGLRKQYINNPRCAAYFIDGTLHQHLWRPRFFESPNPAMTIARWLTDFVNGQGDNIGP